MARYRGPKGKIDRKFKEPIFGSSKVLDRRKSQPGQHGRRRKKVSEYATQLAEKQKTKFIYGLLEKQFRNTFKRAARKSGVTGTVFLQLLESRLDNSIFRMGFAPTRRAARQLVSHKHVMVNGVVTNIASFQLRPGDEVTIREKSRNLEVVNRSLGTGQRFSWLDVQADQYKGIFQTLPEREEIPEKINEQLIVELYSK
ncbi:30S ribosomal protein S4 [Pontibacter sp. G13]|uniref:30S ribosomal protein S4 n=1 Tax=Pontibacter sp. G13 TaxID=3074898 RepID=UPI0028898C28|nr:30S ribosomal protein S4 [Pontibacter sp. G13]WNJ16542.1 30S ribosomal protein S4 [Pontibacter sp. G13]